MRKSTLFILILILAATVSAQSPTPVVVTDGNGNQLTITGSTTGTMVGSPTPVVLTDKTGKALVLGSGSSAAFSAVTAGTNTTAAMVVGTGASLTTSGTGTLGSVTPVTFSGNGALSVSSLLGSGTLITGGTGTTTFPYWYINQGTAPTTFSTAGTSFGVNAPTGFTGNFLDFHVNGGASVFNVNNSGSITAGSFSTSSYANVGSIGMYGKANLIFNTAPTIAGAGCGGSAASIASNNGTAAFTINVGTAPASTGCTITMPAATTAWNCFANDITTNSTAVFLQKQTGAVSTTAVTLQNFSDVAVATAPTGSDIYRVSCFAY